MYALIEKFKDVPDFAVIAGTELYIPESVTFGGKGAVAGGENIFPKIFVDLYKAALDNDLKKITKLRDIVIQIEKKIYNVGVGSSKYIKSIKCALSVLGICNDYVAQPFQKYGKSECNVLKKNLKKMENDYSEIKKEINHSKKYSII